MQPRRAFLAGMLATGLAPQASWADAGHPAFVSAAKKADGSFALYGLKADGEIAFSLPLPARGHAAAVHPTRPEAVAFARRPGTFAVVLDCARGTIRARLEAPEGRHFYGHGAYSADGRRLFTTENDFETARGVVGVWDATRDFRRLTECPSGGVGPHDIKRLPDGTFAVANGGIETHPETGRMKLNIPTMRPNLTYLSEGGTVIDRVVLPPDLRKASIRHLAVDEDGRVAMGLQWQGDVSDVVPLVALHDRRVGRVRLADGTAQRGLGGYVGSIDMAGTEIAVTSPRGGLVQRLEADTLEVTGSHPRADVCGVAALRRDFIVTTGDGLIEDMALGKVRSVPGLAWDNHLLRI